MMGLAVEREFPSGLPDACAALDKLTGARWELAGVEPYDPSAAEQDLEAVLDITPCRPVGSEKS